MNVELSKVVVNPLKNFSRGGIVPAPTADLVALLARGWQDGQNIVIRPLTDDERAYALELRQAELARLNDLKAKWELVVNPLDTLDSEPVTISKSMYIDAWRSLYMVGEAVIQPEYELVACNRRVTSIPLVNALLNQLKATSKVAAITELPAIVKDYLTLADGNSEQAELLQMLDNINENNLKVGAVEPTTLQHLSSGLALLKKGYIQSHLITVFGQKWIAQLIAAVFNANEHKAFRPLKISEGFLTEKYSLKGVKSADLRASIGNTRPAKGEAKQPAWSVEKMTKYLADPSSINDGESKAKKSESITQESVKTLSATSDSFLVKDTLAALASGDKDTLASINLYAEPLNQLYEAIESTPDKNNALALAFLASHGGDLEAATAHLKAVAALPKAE
jgi:hypothetical protein